MIRTALAIIARAGPKRQCSYVNGFCGRGEGWMVMGIGETESPPVSSAFHVF